MNEKMLKKVILVGLFLVTCGGTSRAELIAYWNFNDNVPIGDLLTRNGGINGTLTASNAFTSFSGTTLNRLGSDPAGQAFVYQGGSSLANNGATLTFSGSFTTFRNPVLTFAGERSSTGFNAIQISTSIDGSTFVDFGSAINLLSDYSVQTVDLSSVDILDNSSSAFIRMTFSGATTASGNAKIDNLQISATAIPEPSAFTMIGLIGLCGLAYHSRRLVVQRWSLLC